MYFSAATLFLSIPLSTSFKYGFIYILKMLGIDLNISLVIALVCTHAIDEEQTKICRYNIDYTSNAHLLLFIFLH